MPTKSNLVAFLLSFIPGVGHLYMNRTVRGLLYGFIFFGLSFLLFVGILSHNADEFAFLLIPIGLTWIINMVDMMIYLLNAPAPMPGPVPTAYQQPMPSYYGPYPPEQEVPSWNASSYYAQFAARQERSKVLMLSFIPGVGHFWLGLMQRGLTAMISFFGIAILVFFITILTHNEGFIVFLLALPVLWFYSIFDALKQLDRKQAGLELIDRSMFEDFQRDEHGRKNRTLATIIAIFPGAAHLYLSMTKRGIQLMAVFLFSIYVLDVLRLSLFFFLIPILWFFSFFDALQSISKYENGTLIDKPLVENWTAYQRPIGAVLIVLGGYYIFSEFLVQFLYQFLPASRNYMYLLNNFSQTLIVALLLIGGGIRLLMNRKHKAKPTFSEKETEINKGERELL
jgi:TM2 domain-containing membrane protein YozV